MLPDLWADVRLVPDFGPIPEPKGNEPMNLADLANAIERLSQRARSLQATLSAAADDAHEIASLLLTALPPEPTPEPTDAFSSLPPGADIWSFVSDWGNDAALWNVGSVGDGRVYVDTDGKLMFNYPAGFSLGGVRPGYAERYLREMTDFGFDFEFDLSPLFPAHPSSPATSPKLIYIFVPGGSTYFCRGADGNLRLEEQVTINLPDGAKLIAGRKHIISCAMKFGGVIGDMRTIEYEITINGIPCGKYRTLHHGSATHATHFAISPVYGGLSSGTLQTPAFLRVGRVRVWTR